MRTKALVDPRIQAWVRCMAGLDAEGTVRELGVKPERYEGQERGERRPMISGLCKIANIHKRPLGARRCGSGAG